MHLDPSLNSWAFEVSQRSVGSNPWNGRVVEHGAVRSFGVSKFEEITGWKFQPGEKDSWD
jgi:hypothetical protein